MRASTDFDMSGAMLVRLKLSQWWSKLASMATRSKLFPALARPTIPILRVLSFTLCKREYSAKLTDTSWLGMYVRVSMYNDTQASTRRGARIPFEPIKGQHRADKRVTARCSHVTGSRGYLCAIAAFGTLWSCVWCQRNLNGHSATPNLVRQWERNQLDPLEPKSHEQSVHKLQAIFVQLYTLRPED